MLVFDAYGDTMYLLLCSLQTGKAFPSSSGAGLDSHFLLPLTCMTVSFTVPIRALSLQRLPIESAFPPRGHTQHEGGSGTHPHLVTIPALLVECLRGYMEKWYGLEQDDRIFPYTKSIVNHVMTRACDAVGVKNSHAARRFSHQRLMVTKKPSNVAIL